MRIKKILFLLVFFSILISNLNSEEVDFKAKSLDIKENGKRVIAYNSNTNLKKENINVKSNLVDYFKEKKLIKFKDDVIFYDKNNITIISDNISYEKNISKIFSKGLTEINLDNRYVINGENIYFNRKSQVIYGDDEVIIEDNEKNIFKLKDKYKIDLKNEIIKSKKSEIIDKKNNKYIFDNVVINLKNKEIAGKEVKVQFDKSYFGNEDNEPLLKGRGSYSNDDELKIYKAVFSTCNIQDKKCRGWELSSDEFTHDKKKKLFEYRNSWLKIFDYKVFYLPYFNHPDPSVKRKSGFLTPSYGTSDSLGTYLNFPYFKVIDLDKDLTFKPRYYADKSFLLQNEYRQALKNSNILIDFSLLVGDAGTKGHLFYNQAGKLKNNSNFEINIQNVKGDNYLKTHKLKNSSSLITNDSLLVSNLDFNWNFKDSYLDTSFKIYEDLSRNSNDRYQFIFPDFNFSKNVYVPESYNGKFNFNSHGYNKLYDTNVTESVLTNDFLFSSK